MKKQKSALFRLNYHKGYDFMWIQLLSHVQYPSILQKYWKTYIMG